MELGAIIALAWSIVLFMLGVGTGFFLALLLERK
jgi:hypothetical protein